MGKYIALLFCFYSWLSLGAQSVTDTVSLQAGYTQQAYYSLSQGVQSTAAADAWDLAFEVTGFGSGIRINDGQGIELFLYPNGDSSDWAGLDTAGISTWTPAYNTDTSWAIGAFNRNTDGNFNLGWGSYNMVTHGVYGDSLFVLKLANGTFKKVWIESLVAGTFSFRIADLDNSNEQSFSLDKSAYADRNYAYFSLANGSFSDLEPAIGDWDLFFGRYVAPLAPGVNYGVTGVLSQPNVEVAEVRNLDAPSAVWNGQSLSSDIGTIGWDWKSFNSTTFNYDMVDSLSYFVKDVDGLIWKVVFSGFGGSTDGNFIFEKEQVAVSIEEKQSPLNSFTVYPNPLTGSQGRILVDVERPIFQAQLNLRDLNGRSIKSWTTDLNMGLNALEFGTQGLNNGLYLVELRGGESLNTQQKLLIQH